jgi:lysophospholipid acyltransferase (LPLAT)-like uncharacterized protein
MPVLWTRRLWRQRRTQKAVALIGAEYFRFVFRTNRPVVPPQQLYALAESDLPIILVMWHGQHFLAPFIRRPTDKCKVLISHSSDGEMTAMTAKRLGVDVIRGSGDPGGRFDRKGGVGAFFQMVEALNEGYTVALTADVPKIPRKASLGLVKLASLSGRPIYPIAQATSGRFVLGNWDRTTINLPFGRLGVALGEPVRVPAQVDDAALERARRAIETSLNQATARAYALADGNLGVFESRVDRGRFWRPMEHRGRRPY